MADKITFHTAEVNETAQTIATNLTKAAQPGPVPVAAGASPIDAAAAAVVAGVSGLVAKHAADIAPRSADGLTKTQAAMTGAVNQDEQNAEQIKAVPATMGNELAAGMRPAGMPGQWDPWDDDDDIVKEPVPIIPPGAGPGPSVIPGTGVPQSLI
jgi:hypothetical protein